MPLYYVFKWSIVAILSVFCTISLLHGDGLLLIASTIPALYATCSISLDVVCERFVSFGGEEETYLAWSTRSRHTSSLSYGGGAEQCLKLLLLLSLHKNRLFFSLFLVAQLFIYLSKAEKGRVYGVGSSRDTSNRDSSELGIVFMNSSHA